MANKYLALQKEVFDTNKVTVVGSPTITDDGIASGFSDGNYIEYPITVNATSLRIKGSCIYKFDANLVQQRVISITGGNSTTTTANVYLILTTTGFIFDGDINGAWKRFANLSIKTFTDGDVIDFDITLDLNYQIYNFTVNGEVYHYTTNLELSTFSGYKVIFSYHRAGYSFAGSINLKDSKIYADNQLVYSPTKIVGLLERRKPTVWNKGQFTVVGNPSISESGFISNCSGSNYAKINNPITSVNNKFQVDCTIPIGTGVPFVIYIGNAARMYFWRNANNKLLVVLRSKSADLLNTTVTVSETNLNVKCIVENNTCLVNVNGENLINKTITASAFFEMLNSAEYFTFGSDIGNNPFNQPLNLKTFKIYTDNNLVFDGGAETYVYDPSKFTVVGSPTITEYGVASGFSTSNYLTFPVIDFNSANSWKIEFNYIVPSSAAYPGGIFSPKNGNSINIGEEGVLNGFAVCLSSNGTSWNILDAYPRLSSAKTGDVLKFILSYSDNIYSYKIINLSKESVSVEGSVANSNKIVNRQVHLGCLRTQVAAKGSIILPSLSIMLDGKEVFTGAKVGHYMLRR